MPHSICKDADSIKFLTIALFVSYSLASILTGIVDIASKCSEMGGCKYAYIRTFNHCSNNSNRSTINEDGLYKKQQTGIIGIGKQDYLTQCMLRSRRYTELLEGNILKIFRSVREPWISYKLTECRTMNIQLMLKSMVMVIMFPNLILTILNCWTMSIIKYQQSTLQSSNVYNNQYIASILQYMTIQLKTTHSFFYIVLLGFLVLFEGICGCFGELSGSKNLRFYKDWYNAKSVQEYWHRWNQPVHQFLLIDLYKPLLRKHFTNDAAATIVFIVSAIAHEYVLIMLFGLKSVLFTLSFIMQPFLIKYKEFFRLHSDALAHLFFQGGFMLAVPVLYTSYS
ncbi:hypothetical protein GJ496_006982 [Pomphorhynchus laevis]|nr:hypothetical protein GJ496_007217 [Pomphorhynchus laevis]KAI0989784.1 hypothetical protein GJ496_006982 [Pomphorhynchus laevis]